MASDSTPIGEAGGAPPVGTTFGAYDVRALLGAGGMGRVYRAFDPRLGRDVALKIIRRLTADDESVLDRLMREATLASALNHPNIVTIYETGVVGGDRYIAMELIEGSTLRQLSAQGLPLPRIIGIARQVAEALAVAHAAQIVHRDIKPDNVMVRPDGYAKLLDFGLARARPDQYGSGSTEGGKSSTEAGLILGTIGYMAPEQARGETVTAEADVFSLGVVLYELVTGRHPFMAASQLGTLNALLWETPEPPSLLNPELPRAVDQLILESLQKDQRLRPGASEVMYRLALAHDSNIATALLGGHGRAAAALRNVERRRPRRRARGAQPRVRARASRQGAAGGHLGRSRRRQDDARRSLRERARGARPAGARRPRALLRTARGQLRRTCRCSRRSRASSGTNSSAASRASSARSRRAGTRSSCRRPTTTRRPHAWPPKRPAGRRSDSSAKSRRCSRRPDACSRSCSGSTTCIGPIRRRPIFWGTWRGGSTTRGCSSSRRRGRRSCASRVIRSSR